MRSRSLVVALLGGALLLPAAALPAVAQSPSAAPTTPAAAESAAPQASVAIGDPDLARAVDATIATGTVRTSFALMFGGGGTVPDGTSVTGDGQTNFGLERRQRLSMDMTAFGVGAFELIIDGQTIYVKGLPFGPDVPADTWLKADLTSDDPSVAMLRSLASGNNDASLLLYYLLGAPGPAELVGEEEIDGVATRHLTTALDLDRALALAPAEIRDTLAQNVAEIEQGGMEPLLDGEVWVDASDLVRRISLAYQLGAATGGGTMTVTFDFRQHGEPLDLGIPAPEDTVDLATLGA
ncbi:MAG: hypothetical protein IT200_15495 [Thermoleophilia bacterium]|nr:hypothetical protein [Thermoleophilia bacterium]